MLNLNFLTEPSGEMTFLWWCMQDFSNQLVWLEDYYIFFLSAIPTFQHPISYFFIIII